MIALNGGCGVGYGVGVLGAVGAVGAVGGGAVVSWIAGSWIVGSRTIGNGREERG